VKVYVYAADTGGCGYYRLIWPAMALAMQDHDVTVVLPKERDEGPYAVRGYIQRGEIIDVDVPSDADVIVLQRVTHRFMSRAVPLIRKKGIAVVVDMDDDLGKVHPSNPAYAALHPSNGGEHSWLNADFACRHATLVTTSTIALRKTYAPLGNGAVLHNMIPRSMLSIPRRDEGRFGWTGYLGSHPNDPQVMGHTVQQLVNEGFPFSMIGNPEGIAREMHIEESQLHTTGVVDTLAWGQALATLHVGLAPLSDTKFNRAKSWLKPLELAAVGVPCVMSPRAEYTRLHRLGVGVLASSPKEWYAETKRLMTDDDWYAEVVKRSTEAVSELTIEENAFRWAEAWQSAWLLERRQHSVLARRTG
jgi:hypothetical protein